MDYEKKALVGLLLSQSKHDEKTQSASGDSSQLAAYGDYSKLAASGDYPQLAAYGKSSICMAAGIGSQASAGEMGTIALTYWDDEAKRYRVVVGYIGENGLVPNVMYQLDYAHKFKVVE
jgi:hypothetical protein